MENHPIPQDVTGFKFKLVGSMTIKQFGYLILAGVFCLIVFLFPMNFLLKIPFFIIFGGFGVGLAFIPIEGRPMDKMIINFAKALPRENQFVYRKHGVNLQEYEMFKPLQTAQTKPQAAIQSDTSKKNALASQLRNSYFRPDKDEMSFLQNIKSEFENPSTPISPVLPVQQVKTQPLPATPRATQPVQLPAQESIKQIIKTPIQADTPQFVSASPVPSTPVIETPVTQIVQQPSTQTQPLIDIAQQEKELRNSVHETQLNKTSLVKSATDRQAQLNAGFPTLPDIPNVVLGVVRDPRGKALPYILVEVLDRQNIPVRAFKTNQLGQFSAATPLSSGTYRVIFEDPQKKNEFEPIEISLDGTSIFQPLEISSVDQREKLRRELFGATPITSP